MILNIRLIYNRTTICLIVTLSILSKIRRRKLKPSTSNSVVEMAEDGPGKKMQLKKPLEIYIDGPFGAPSSNIFRAEHAVLIGTGIGVTPFASILQSIMHRYWEVKRQCPQCQFQWSDEISSTLNYHLKKVRSIGRY